MTINLNVREYDRARLEAFKVRQPYDPLPETLEYVAVEYGPTGDVVNVTALDQFGEAMDIARIDPVSLLALRADIRRDGYTPIVLADTDDWLEFVEVNREALIDEFGSVERAYRLACNMSLWLGGGAAPLIHVRFPFD